MKVWIALYAILLMLLMPGLNTRAEQVDGGILKGTWEWDQGRYGVATLAVDSVSPSGGLRGSYVYMDGRGREYRYLLRDDGGTDPGIAVGSVKRNNGTLLIKITLYPETSTFELSHSKLLFGEMLVGPFHFVPRNSTFEAKFYRKKL